MTEDDFLRLGIPSGAAAKLKAYISNQSPPPLSPLVTKRKREDVSDPASTEGKRPKLTPKQSDSEPPASIEVISSQPWDDSINPRNWLMTEAIDGVRCLWNGSELIAKNGAPFPAPLFFTETLPRDVVIDGYLYLPGESSKKCLLAAKKPEIDGWKQVKIALFDLPMLRKPLEDRIFQLQTIVQTLNLPFATTPIYTVCCDTDHLRSELARISEFHPDGLLIRQPGSLYDPKRSKSLLKVKKPVESEGTVAGYDPGKGKYEGLIGALRVRTDDGREFKLISGLNDVDRKYPPLIGARICFQYQEISSSGVPKFPVFVRVREDAGNRL